MPRSVCMTCTCMHELPKSSALPVALQRTVIVSWLISSFLLAGGCNALCVSGAARPVLRDACRTGMGGGARTYAASMPH